MLVSKQCFKRYMLFIFIVICEQGFHAFWLNMLYKLHVPIMALENLIRKPDKIEQI